MSSWQISLGHFGLQNRALGLQSRYLGVGNKSFWCFASIFGDFSRFFIVLASQNEAKIELFSLLVWWFFVFSLKMGTWQKHCKNHSFYSVLQCFVRVDLWKNNTKSMKNQRKIDANFECEKNGEKMNEKVRPYEALWSPTKPYGSPMEALRSPMKPYGSPTKPYGSPMKPYEALCSPTKHHVSHPLRSAVVLSHS